MKKIIIVLFQIITLLLFISAHYLETIYYYARLDYLFFYVDLSLISGIILQLVIIVLLLTEVRK